MSERSERDPWNSGENVSTPWKGVGTLPLASSALPGLGAAVKRSSLRVKRESGKQDAQISNISACFSVYYCDFVTDLNVVTP